MLRRLSPIALAAALVVLTPRGGTAQTFPTDDAVLKRIWALGMDSSQTMRLSQVLFDSIGPRLTGTPNAKGANDWLVRTYQGWGVDARNEQWGKWRSWRQPFPASLQVVGAWRARRRSRSWRHPPSPSHTIRV